MTGAAPPACAHLQNVSVDVMRKKIKRLWMSSKNSFLKEEKQALAATGEGAMDAADLCQRGDESEVSSRSAGSRECDVMWGCPLFDTLRTVLKVVMLGQNRTCWCSNSGSVDVFGHGIVLWLFTKSRPLVRSVGFWQEANRLRSCAGHDRQNICR